MSAVSLCYTRSRHSCSTSSQESGGLSAKLSLLIETIKTQSPDCIEAIPGNAVLVNLPNASEIATEWIDISERRSSATTVELEVTVKLLKRASELLTDQRQWYSLFCFIYMMQTSKTGIAFLHSKVIEDIVGGWRNAEPLTRLLNDRTLFHKVIEPAQNVTATGYQLAQQPDVKAPSIYSKKLTSSFSKSLTGQQVSRFCVGEHSMAFDVVGSGGDGVEIEERKEDENKTGRFFKLTGKYRVQSVRMLVYLGSAWDAVRESISKRWGHLDAAADGAGRLDVLSEQEAIEIAERHFHDDDDEATKAGQRSAAVDFVRFVRSSREARIRAIKWRASRMYYPGMSLRSEARTEIMRYLGEMLWQVDVAACYWWVLCAEIRRALLLARSDQSIKDQIKTTRSIDNIERLLCIISAGKFYEYFAEQCGIDLNTVKERINMLCLFNKNNLGGPEFQLLQQEWPDVAGVIRRLRNQVGGTSTLSRFLNGLEGQLMNGALKSLADDGHPVLRIHDGLAVPEAVVPNAIAAIRIQAETRFGIVPGFKIEKPDGTKTRRRGEIAEESAGESDRWWRLALPETEQQSELADYVIRQIVGADFAGLAV